MHNSVQKRLLLHKPRKKVCLYKFYQDIRSPSVTKSKHRKTAPVSLSESEGKTTRTYMSLRCNTTL